MRPPPGGPPLALAGGGQLDGTNVATGFLDPFALGSGIPTAMAMSQAKQPNGKPKSQESPGPKEASVASFSDDELAQHARAILAIGKANHKVIRHRLLDTISRAIDALAKAQEVRVPAVFGEPVELMIRFNRRRWTRQIPHQRRQVDARRVFELFRRHGRPHSKVLAILCEVAIDEGDLVDLHLADRRACRNR